MKFFNISTVYFYAPSLYSLKNKIQTGTRSHSYSCLHKAFERCFKFEFRIETNITYRRFLVYLVKPGAVLVAQVVAHWTMDREVPGLIPTGLFSLSLLYPIFQSVVRPLSGLSWRCNATGFHLSQKMKA